VTPGFPSWPAPLQAFALVVNPKLGLRQQWFSKKNMVKTPSKKDKLKTPNQNG
jgi:hypothetical protein